MDDIARIVEHLRGRPIAEIFEQSNEKDNIVALKLMCILDFYMEHLNFYAKIEATNPNLLGLLLQFSSFASFKYYDYVVPKAIGTRVLRCKFCDLVGSYALILTHMALNHNAHIGIKTCLYCQRVELEKHFVENSLDQCYQKYIQRSEWNDQKLGVNVLEIVANFYLMLRKLSKKFDACSIRHKQYTGLGYKAVEKLTHNYGDDFPNECMVFKQPKARKNLKDVSTSIGLDIEFNRAMNHFYGTGDNNIMMSPIQLLQRTPSHAAATDDQQQYLSMAHLVNANGNQHQFGTAPKNESMAVSSMEMTMDTAASTSFANQMSSRNESPAPSFILCTTTTQHQPQNGESVDNFQAVPRVSSSNISFGARPSLNAQDNNAPAAPAINDTSYESVVPGVNLGAVYNQLPFDTVQFGLFVAQRLTRLPDERSRRKLEHAIQGVILDIEREFFE